MRYSAQVKPISYLKGSAAEILLVIWPRGGSRWSSRRMARAGQCGRTWPPLSRRKRRSRC